MQRWRDFWPKPQNNKGFICNTQNIILKPHLTLKKIELILGIHFGRKPQILACGTGNPRKSYSRMRKRLTSITRQFKHELGVYRLVLKDKRTPWLAKIFLGAAVAYMLSPIDIIPDFIPVLGHLDDLVIVPILVFVGLKLIQKEVVDDARNAMRLSREGVQHVTASELPKARPLWGG